MIDPALVRLEPLAHMFSPAQTPQRTFGQRVALHGRNPQIGADVVEVLLQEAHHLAKRTTDIGPTIEDERREMFDRSGKRSAFIEHGAQMVTKDDNLLHDCIRVFRKQFIKRLPLFRRQILFIGKHDIAILPQFCMCRFAHLVLILLGYRSFERFSVRS